MTSRRDILKKIFKGAAAVGSGGMLWGTATIRSNQGAPALRPPGALENENQDKDIESAIDYLNSEENL